MEKWTHKESRKGKGSKKNLLTKNYMRAKHKRNIYLQREI